MSDEHDQKSALVPRLRFPEFRGAGAWGTQPLRSVAQLLDGDWIESKDQSADGVRLIQTGNIGIGYFIPKDGNARFISEETFCRLKCIEVVPGDCLISRLPDPAGRSCLIPDMGSRMITAVDCTIVRFNLKKIIPYLFISFSQTDQYFSEVQAQASGSTRLRISRDNLSNIEIPLTSLHEQQKIADCLSSLDELIAAQAQKLDALKTHKKGLMQRLFPAEGETVPRLRFPEFRENWMTVTASDFFDLTDKLEKTTIFDKNKVLTVKLHAKGVVKSEKTTLTGGANYFNRRAGQFVFSKIDVLNGAFGVVPDGLDGFASSSDVPAYSFNAKRSSRFFVNWLKANYEQLEIERTGTSSTLKRVSLEEFLKLPVQAPKLGEQQKIADCLSALDDLIDAQTQKIELLKRHKKGLMQQLFPVLDEVLA